VGAKDASGNLVIDLSVHPKGSRPTVGPMVSGRLRVVVSAPPTDGKANKAVILALAEAFGVAPSAVTILRGETGRKKTVRIVGATQAVLDRLSRDPTENTG
jgi:uncharacterized protein (TIGR00251 family)